MQNKKVFFFSFIVLVLIGFASKAFAILTLSNAGITGDVSFNNLTITGLSSSGSQCLHISSAGLISGTGSDCGSGGGGALSLDVLADASSNTKYPSVKAIKDYADSLIVGLLNYRGGFNASVNAYPSTLGSGAGGIVRKGDLYIISTPGTINGVAVHTGDTMIANIDSPGQTTANWNVLNADLSVVPEDVANKSINIITDGSSDIKYPSVKSVKDYADSLVAGLLDYRGGYDASGGSYPSTLGSGAGGTVKKGDTYVISTAGTLGGNPIQVGDSIIANTDSPGNTSANWNTLNTNVTYVPENQANKVTSVSGASTDIQYPTAKLLFDQLALKQGILNITTTGTSGAATIAGNTLNIPQYSGGGASPLTTKGDLFTFDTAGQRLPVGTDGQVLSSDSTQATGLKWIAAGGGGGSPGGLDGQVQLKSGTSFTGQAFGLNSGISSVFERAIECATGTISVSGANWTTSSGTMPLAAATSQDIPIITGLNGNQRYTSVLVSEATIFTSASVTGTKISIGRPGASTDDEMLPQTSFMQSSGNSWFAEDRPQSPILGSANSYSLVLAVRTTGGNVSALTGGAVNYEVCGYKTP